MTISTQLNKIVYSGDGATTQWTFSFPGHDNSAIIVYITDAAGNVIQLTSLQYQVALNPPVQPNPTGIGGVVIYPMAGPPLPVGQKITIRRLLPMVQQTSFPNQSVIYPPIVETDDDYLTMVDQQLQEQIDRAIKVNVSDPNPAPLPPASARAGLNAIFDSFGNLTAGVGIAGGITVSAAMVPVVTAATLKAAQIAFGLGPFGYGALNGNKIYITNAFTVSNAQKGMTFLLDGNALYTLTIPAPSAAIDDDFQILIFVLDSRGKRIAVPGYPGSPFMLWPGQFMLLSKFSGEWLVMQPPRWKPVNPITFYVNPAQGADTNDGLARGGGAFQTIQGAVNAIQRFTDGQFTIVPEAGFGHTVGSGVVLDGLQFQRAINIVGDGPVGPPGIGITADTGGTVFQSVNNAVLGLNNLYIGLNNPGSSGGGISASQGAVINLANCSFGGFTGVHMSVANNAVLNISGFYDIYGGALNHIYAAYGGSVNWACNTVGFNSPVSIGTFLEAVFNSQIFCPAAINFANPTFMSGKQWLIDYNSSLVTQGATIPGTTPGETGIHGGYVV